MNIWLVIGALLFSPGNVSWLKPLTVPAANEEMHQLALVMRCRAESSPLVRLECYDNALLVESENRPEPVLAGPVWQRAMEQEQSRNDHSTAFLVNAGEGPNPMVVVTTSALGVPPPRPVLMLSCIDNITRMQIALAAPQKEGAVTLSADADRFSVQWFLRENGYLLESSRGLAGIDEIKRLIPARTLEIDGAGSSFPHLTFNISQLAQALKPLRAACHW